MLRNVASQKYRVFAWDRTTGAPKTGDAANISAYITKDDGTPAATNDAAPTEVSSTNEPGYYDFDLTQAETSAAKVSLSPKSSTSNIVVVACPPVVYTRPQYASLLGIESDGDLTKVNTLNGHTAQTGDSYPIVSHVSHGNAALKTALDLKATQASVDLKASQASVDDLPTNTELGTALTSAVAPLLTSADFTSGLAALMMSASRRVTLGTGLAYEIPDSGTADYFIELRTFDEDGAPVAADSTPTLTATGGASGNLSANLSVASNPATGVYRWTYTVDVADPVEPIRLDASAVIDGSTFTVPAFPVVTDAVAVDFTATDRTNLASVLAAAQAAETASESADTKATAIQAKTDLIPAVPASQGDVTAARDSVLSKLLKYVQLIYRKDAAIKTDNATELTAINASGGSGAGSADNETDSLQAQADAGGGGGGGTATLENQEAIIATQALHTASLAALSVGAGSGPLEVVLRFLDQNADPVPNLRAYVYSGSTLVAAPPTPTDANGDVTVWLAVGSFGVAGWLLGFEQDTTPNPITVSAAGTKTITGTLHTPAAHPNPLKSTGQYVCYDEMGQEESGVPVTVRLIKAPPGIDGMMLDKAPWTVTSDGDGIVEFGPTVQDPDAGLFRGGIYAVKRGDSTEERRIEIPDEASFNMKTFLGTP
jgi:hypothetical protein